jgi:hypothetical protein
MNKILSFCLLVLPLQIFAQSKTMSGVPMYIWSNGCGPTSVGMVVGYYDTHGYPDLFPGDGSTQSAIDDYISSYGHYTDYSLPIDDETPTILPDNSELLPENERHPNDCIADYMYTSQSAVGNRYGWSLPDDIVPAWENYIADQAPNYAGTGHKYDFTDFPMDSLVSNIDRNRPMVFLVDYTGDGVYDHFVTVIGYRKQLGINYYRFYDTWEGDGLQEQKFQQMANGVSWGVLDCYTFEVHLKLPADAGSISGPANVCKDQTAVVYTVPVIAGATSYIWTLPSGATGSSTTNSISVDFGSTAVSGNITVKGHNDNGDGLPSSFAVTVSSPLSAPGSISGQASVCQGSNQVYSITPLSGAVSYTWTLPSGWNGTSTTPSITATAGASGTISVVGNNACGSSSPSTLNITVSSAPDQPGPITGGTSVCQGSQQVYSIATVTGATSYTWSLPSGWSGTSNSETITVTAGTTGGTISVTANNTCGSGTARNLIVSVINLLTQPGTITGGTNVCQGSNQVYSIASVSGATSYTWTLPSGWSGNSTTESIPVTVGSSGGTISVTANNSCGSSSPKNLSVIVSTVPNQPGSITGSTSACLGSDQVYSISSVPGATSYVWTLPSGWTGSSNSESITATLGSVGGTISVAANNACGLSTARNLSVTVLTVPARPASITGETSVCQGSSHVYNISTVAGATSYTWTLPSGWSGTSNSESITATAGASGGSISVTANNSCGSSTIRSLTVTVTPIPGQPGAISGNTSICQGSTQVYSISSVAGATSYTWTLPSGWSGTSNSVSITAIAGATGGSISVTANNSCGSGISRNLTISVTPIVAQPDPIAGETTVCQGSDQTYSIASVPGATSYIWNLPSGWSGYSDSESITATAGASGGTISVTANNSCGSGAPRNLSVTVTTPPDQPGAISGATTVCQGSSQIYSITPVTGASSYTWTLPSGWSGNSTSESINTTVGLTGGNISVTANNSCGSRIPRNLSVSVSTVPSQPDQITGLTSVCQGQSSVTYSVPVIADATSYTWTLPSGASGSSNSNLITVNYNTSAISGNITVKGNNSCGSGSSSSLYVNVNPIPPAPIITLNDNVLHSNAPLGNQWYNYQSGLIPDATEQDYTALEEDSYYDIVTLNGCASDISNIIYVLLTGIESPEISMPVKVYPNPVKNELIIEKPGNTESIKFVISNSLGQIVYTGNLVEKTIVPTSGFYRGIYILKIGNGNSFVIKKIIKE